MGDVDFDEAFVVEAEGEAAEVGFGGAFGDGAGVGEAGVVAGAFEDIGLDADGAAFVGAVVVHGVDGVFIAGEEDVVGFGKLIGLGAVNEVGGFDGGDPVGGIAFGDGGRDGFAAIGEEMEGGASQDGGGGDGGDKLAACGL